MTKVTLFAQVIQKNEANYNLTKKPCFPTRNGRQVLQPTFCRSAAEGVACDKNNRQTDWV